MTAIQKTATSESHSRRHAAPAPHNDGQGARRRRRRRRGRRTAHQQEFRPHDADSAAICLSIMVRYALPALENDDLIFAAALLREAQASADYFLDPLGPISNLGDEHHDRRN